MTHTVWCDAHLATPRQCGGTPAVQPGTSMSSTNTRQTLSNTYDVHGRQQYPGFAIKLSGWHLVVSERASVVIYRKIRAAWLPWKQCSSGVKRKLSVELQHQPHQAGLNKPVGYLSVPVLCCCSASAMATHQVSYFNVKVFLCFLQTEIMVTVQWA